MLRRSGRSAGIAPSSNDEPDYGVEPETEAEARGHVGRGDGEGVGAEEGAAGEGERKEPSELDEDEEAVDGEMWPSGAEDGDRTVAGLGAELDGDQFDRDGCTSKEPTVQGMLDAVILAKHYQDRIADALSGEDVPLFTYYGVVRLAEEFAAEWGGPHLVHRAEKLVSSASTGKVCRIGDRPRSPPNQAWWEALTRRLADGITAGDVGVPAKAATREFCHGGIAESGIDQSGGTSMSRGPDRSFIGRSIGGEAQKELATGRGNMTAKSGGSSGVTIAWCPGYGAVGSRWEPLGAVGGVAALQSGPESQEAACA